MVESVGSSSASYQLQSAQEHDPKKKISELLDKITDNGSTSGVSKDQLESYAETLSSDNPDSKIVSDLISNFDSVSPDGSSVSSSDIDTALKNGTIGPKKGGDPKGGADKMLSDLASKIGVDSSSITKDSLEEYLSTLDSSDSDYNMVSDLINNFDSVSSDGSNLSSSAIDTAFKNGSIGPKNKGEIQDPSTITTEQLESPIDISV